MISTGQWLICEAKALIREVKAQAHEPTTAQKRRAAELKARMASWKRDLQRELDAR